MALFWSPWNSLLWIIANGPEIISALFAIHAAALAVVNLTPTPKDDVVVASTIELLKFLLAS